jgi:hypothetical protein
MVMATMSMTNGSGIQTEFVSVCTVWNENLTAAVFVPIDFHHFIYFQPANSEVDLVCELRICPAPPSSY